MPVLIDREYHVLKMRRQHAPNFGYAALTPDEDETLDDMQAHIDDLSTLKKDLGNASNRNVREDTTASIVESLADANPAVVDPAATTELKRARNVFKQSKARDRIT